MLEVLPPNAGTRANPIRAYAASGRGRPAISPCSGRSPGLRPATRYRYRFHQGGVDEPDRDASRTAPRASAGVGVRFAITGDADATPGPNGKPGLQRLRDVRGDDARAERLQHQLRRHHLLGLRARRCSRRAHRRARSGRSTGSASALAPLRQLRAAAGLYSGWDDHEFVNDFSGEEHGAPIYRDGVRAFLDYTPATYTPPRGLYRTFRWGRHLQLFFLDARSFRSAKATAVVRRRHRPDRAAGGSPGVRRALPGACEAGASGMPRRDRLARADPPRARSARRASALRSAPRRRPSRSSSTPSR